MAFGVAGGYMMDMRRSKEEMELVNRSLGKSFLTHDPISNPINVNQNPYIQRELHGLHNASAPPAGNINNL